MAQANQSTLIPLQIGQLRNLAKAVGQLGDARSTSDLKVQAFEALESFGPGSLICFEKFNLLGTNYEVSYNGDGPSQEDVAVFTQLYHQHPYIEYLKKGGNELALRPTDIICPSKWHKTALYNELYIKNHAHFGMCSRVFVPCANEHLNFTALRDREFSDAEQALTRVYLEETRRAFARVHLSSEPVEAFFINNCRKSGLSERETEVLTNAFSGKTDKEIATALGNSQRTVQHQLQSIYRKLKVGTRVEAIRRLLKGL